MKHSTFPNWFFMKPSIATKFQYVYSLFFIFPSYPLHVSAPTGHPQLSYTIRCGRSSKTAHTIIREYKRLLTLNFNIFHFYIFIYETSFTMNINVITTFILSLITCIGDHGSKYRYRHTSSCVRTADPL
jgi:hypothetical protein